MKLSFNKSDLLFQFKKTDLIQLKKIDYLEFYVGNAKQSAYFYANAFGFKPVAYAGLETGVSDRTSYVLEQGDIRLVLTSPLTLNNPIAEYLKLHGDGIYDIAMLVDDACSCFETAVAKGAQPLLKPHKFTNKEGYLVKATIAAYNGDLCHSFIERKNYNLFSPEYIPLSNFIETKPTGLIAVDHLVLNVEIGQMNPWAGFYQKILGFQEQQEFTSDDISTKYSALISKVLQNNPGKIKIPINEPAQGLGKSQIQEYLDFHNGPGVQHLALKTTDIISTVRHLRSNGVEFLDTSCKYYDNLLERIGEIDEDIDTLRELQILVDRDSEGYLLQIFTKPLTPRPTFFIEIIQRKGSMGFGKGNFKALFETIELEQAARGNLL